MKPLVFRLQFLDEDDVSEGAGGRGLTSWCPPAASWGLQWRFCCCPAGRAGKTCRPCPGCPESLWTPACSRTQTPAAQLAHTCHSNLPALLCRPGERHPVLAQALARLPGRFEDLLRRLQKTPKFAQIQDFPVSKRDKSEISKDLVHVGGLDVWFRTVGDAILENLLHTGHQENICMGVCNREDPL